MMEKAIQIGSKKLIKSLFRWANMGFQVMYSFLLISGAIGALYHLYLNYPSEALVILSPLFKVLSFLFEIIKAIISVMVLSCGIYLISILVPKVKKRMEKNG